MNGRYNLRTAARDGAVALLEAYRDAASVDNLSIYRARPRSILPPHAFVDGINETIRPDFTVEGDRQRIPLVDVIIVHGLFDSGDSVDQGDAFVDGFLNYVADNPHAFGGNTTVDVIRTQDLANYVPEWITDPRRSYYATVITLQGFAAT